MNDTASDLGSRDSLRKTWQVISLWGLPAVVATIALVLADRRPALFLAASAALLVMGGACLVNAARCRRLHCYITGPYFLMLALGALLAYGFAPNGEYHSRLWLLLALGVTPLLIWLPERLAGRKYLSALVCGEDRECR
ncbi:TPA: hypothetical protein VDV13_003519 [Pseudomonas aeruginosa]|jgi:hypothetical protein|uniref:Uncharacterized protein n=9 Tax=Pseudomonas TaxID=286 RepID=A0A2L1KDN1_PSEAI|nr:MULTISPECIES: hypothetical protein [Pseudomonadota]PYG97448.1 hypothetical protein CVV67_27120 [Arthrobacter stackebrandtii]BDD36750.1 hypothetical protein [uncultured bacterium]AGN82239.1 hypothetical protein L483_14925 [Pseudomonas putida H8234]AJO78990.1 hypothetical protein TO66_17535 [Pseudomonas sp. MRSN 12121]AMP35876.1 Hypothetical protein [Pseudomonas aeruginosa]